LTGVTEQQVRGLNRSRTIVEAKQAMMFALWDGKMSYAAIGRLLGKHHTTVMHGVNEAAALRESSDAFRVMCGVLRRLIFNEEGTDNGEGRGREVDGQDGPDGPGDVAHSQST
jgi:hypothetical protein